MRPECAFTVHADCGVRIIPLIGGIILIKTSLPSTHSFIYLTVVYYKSLLITISICYIFLLGINLWKGMLQKQPALYSLLLLYIIHRSKTQRNA